MANVSVPPEVSPSRKRTRSPAYPFINLETAINRAKQFYDKEQRNAANISVATKHWGFVEASSNGWSTVAALISFGLMQDEGIGDRRIVRLTQSALRILLDARQDSAERAELLRVAALGPKIHRQLWKKWGAGLPSDAQLRHTLLFDWETPFNENSVDFFISEYKSTVAFAKLAESDKDRAPEVKEEGAAQEQRLADVPSTVDSVPEEAPAVFRQPSALRVPEIPSIPASKVQMQEFVVPLSDGRRAVFQWPSSLMKEDVEDLRDSLKILERKITRSTTERKESPLAE
ncbi:MAG TPA: hypothetical protein VMQ56_07880 [Terracidiphilus sp.]|nr:hypothetical protein [Terracidiphilus sp.]